MDRITTKIVLPRQRVKNALHDLLAIERRDKKKSFSKKEVRLANSAMKNHGIRKEWMSFDAMDLD